MALLGAFREGIDRIRLHLRSDRALRVDSIRVRMTLPGEDEALLPFVAEPDADPIPNNSFRNSGVIDLEGRHTGVAQLTAEAADTLGRVTRVVNTLRVVNSYGRGYGLDYGNGF